jgi:transcriptional regulator GlxA family with amidase domain
MMVFTDEPKINDAVFEYYASLRRVQEYAVANFSSKISLDVVASVAGMEKTYFSSFFHKKVGLPFMNWLSLIRLRAAVDLLSCSDRSVSETAYLVGFGDVRTFERQFKKYARMTPQEYKREVRRLLSAQSMT